MCELVVDTNVPPPGFIRFAQPGISFNYGNQQINVKRSYRATDINKVLIKVHPTCKVEVFAPKSASDEEILVAVKKRGRWIYKQLNEFARQQAYVTARSYVSGESHHYLGRQYVLKVNETALEAPKVKLLRGRFEIAVKDKSRDRVKAQLDAWYKNRAKEVFSIRLDKLLGQALWVEKTPPIRLLTMRTQWGSCSPNGRLTINPHLVKAPGVCIDYVILHELCHLAEHNHSEHFYRLMNRVMPDWQRVKSRLDQSAHKYLVE